jgi:hypothetical protein
MIKLPTKIKIPKQVKVGGHTIDVILEDDLELNHEAQGLWKNHHDKIVLDSGLADAVMAETFFHELVEAINSIYDLKLPHVKISVLGAVIHQVLTDNELIE